MTFKVLVRPAARRDLSRLAKFTAKLSPRAASERSRGLLDAIEALVDNPLRGHRTSSRHDLRQIVVRFGRSSYVIRYRVTDEAVYVIRIWHGREKR